ncbi:ROK family transcriptional regulator [Actinosynnema sp. NPDC020468]|uniref:ROK family transcriptional regulator n=1 Tax=Actinosynnema sp. NPDC020468 TaxID=3154488 RepID=UPI0033F62737
MSDTDATDGHGELARLVALGSATTRADLARLTGLSRSTVSHRVEALLAGGVLVEGGEPVPSSGGRRGTRLRLDGSAGLLLTADLGATAARLAVSDLNGVELAASTEDHDIDQDPEPVLRRVVERFAELLAGRDAERVRAVVVGLPAPVEFGLGHAVKPPLMPATWHRHPVADHFADRFPRAEVLIDNDTNLMALGEHRETYPGLRHLLYVKVGTGIGCGVVVGGELYRGAGGAAGDIGHIRLGHDETPCRCGNTGCLEVVAGGKALAARLRAQGRDAPDARAVVRLAEAGDVVARSEVRAAARRIGEVLAAVISFANPEAIVLGGSLARLDQALLAGIRAVLFERAFPLSTHTLRTEVGALGDRAGTVGAVTLAQRHLLSDRGIGALLGSR